MKVAFTLKESSYNTVYLPVSGLLIPLLLPILILFLNRGRRRQPFGLRRTITLKMFQPEMKELLVYSVYASVSAGFTRVLYTGI